MSLLRFVSSAAVAFACCVSALHATLGTAFQTQLGNPSNAATDVGTPNNYLIPRDQFTLSYNNNWREANWVSWSFTPSDRGSQTRTDAFAADPLLPGTFNIIDENGYRGSGFDRGHMCPSADRTLSRADNEATFVMTNMVPQTADNNQGVWANFEQYTRDQAALGNEILIISGPSGFGGSTLASGVAIPGYTWKIAVIVPNGAGTALSRITAATRVIAIKVPNIAGVRSTPWANFVTSSRQLQTDTGLSFFNAITDATLRNALLDKVDGQTTTGAPSISTQPTAQSAPVAGSATFTVAATSTTDTNFTYRWLKDGEPIDSATASSLTFTNVQASDAANYSVVVTNSVASITSSAVALVVTGLPPSITSQPVAASRSAGSTATFSVTVSGSPTLTYQWRKVSGGNLANGGNISGATSPTLTLTNVQAADAGSYEVVVTNSVNSATSNPAALTVTPAAPTIATQPVARTVAAGGTATFTVVATGTAPLTYTWRKGGTPIVGNSSAATATLTLTSVQAADAANYDVVVSNGVAPDATSNAVALTVNAAGAGQVAYSGGTYAQNFNGLPATGTFTLTGNGPHLLDAAPINATGLTGWSLVKHAGSGTNATFQVNNGSGNSGAVYSYGVTGEVDRALGSLGSGSVQSRLGVVLLNTTGQTITEFTVNYTGEQWRHGGATTANTLAFAYALGGSDLNTGTFTPVTALDFVGLNTSTTTAALVGNDTANRAARSATVTGISWAANQTLVLRWTDVDDSGSDDGLAIDDFSFSTNATGTVVPAVASTTPAANATGISPSTTIAITFNQAVTVSGSWFTINSAANGAVAAVVTASSDSRTYTLTPPASFPENDTVTVTLIATQIRDQATGALSPAANTTFSFTTTAPTAPTISTQPAAQTVTAGGTATFTVAASGTAPFTYQWRKGTTNLANASGSIAGASSATLTLSNLAVVDAGNYNVVVTNSVSSVTSNDAALTVNPATVATTVNFTGAEYTQNFDTLPATGTFTFTGNGPFALNAPTPGLAASGAPGWSFAKHAGSGSNALFRVGTGSDNAGAAYSFGVAAASDRALGALGSGTAASRFGFALVNTTGATITQFTLRYTGEQWRFGGSTTPNKLAFAHSTDATDINAGTFTSVAALDFTSIITSGTSGALDGNATANRAVVTAQVTGLTWAAGQTLFLRWTDVDDAGSDDGLAVDEVVFTTALPAAPVIAQQPLPQVRTVTVGGSTTFSVVATGVGPLTYQWRKNGDNMSDGGTATGTRTASLTLSNVTSADAGSYYCLVSNGGGATPSDSAGLSIAKAAAIVVLGSLTQTFTGSPLPITVATTPAGLTTTVTYNGSATVPTAAGTYPVVATVSDANYEGSASGTFTISPPPATVVTVSLSGLNATYDGTPKPVAVSTTPAGISTTVTYNGAPNAPTDAGSYAVLATVNQSGYTGMISGTLTIAKAPQTISFAALADQTTASAPFTLSASATSSLPVSFELAVGPATLSGNTVTLSGTTGTVTIRAVQPGSVNYAPATPVERSFAVTPANVAPTITAQPVSLSVPVGAPATFSVTATGTPAPTYQWLKNGATIAGATDSSFRLAGVARNDAGTYSVVVTNASGSVTSNGALLAVIRRSFAGVYFGTLGNGGTFALYINEDNTGVFLGYAPGFRTAYISRSVTVNDDGTFSFTTSTLGSSVAAASVPGAPPFAAAIDDLVFQGSISSTGTVTGSAPSGLSLTATKSDAGTTASSAGFYQAGAAGTSAQTLAIVSPAGQAFVLTQSGTTVDAGTGTVDATGRLNVTTAAQNTFIGAVSAATASLTATLTDARGTVTTFTGLADTPAARATQRLVNLSTRASAGTGDQVAIVGFVITGNADKSVLIRAIGPGLRAFGVPTALASPRLDLVRGTATIASNISWTTATNASELATAATSAGAFPLTAGSADAAILTSLAPGAYTAIVSSTTATGGPALLEVYELSGDSLAQKLVNLSTRAAAGTGDTSLIAGLVVGGTAPKRVLIRAAGPALTAFGVTSALARPELTLRSANGAVVAQNAGWSASADATAIAEGALRVGAFAFGPASADAALIVNLAPGNYTAQVTGANNTTGTALVEVYELP